jgi:hypothetical protein
VGVQGRGWLVRRHPRGWEDRFIATGIQSTLALKSFVSRAKSDGLVTVFWLEHAMTLIGCSSGLAYSIIKLLKTLESKIQFMREILATYISSTSS